MYRVNNMMIFSSYPSMNKTKNVSNLIGKYLNSLDSQQPIGLDSNFNRRANSERFILMQNLSKKRKRNICRRNSSSVIDYIFDNGAI